MQHSNAARSAPPAQRTHTRPPAPRALHEQRGMLAAPQQTGRHARQQNRLAAKQGEQGKGDQWRSSDLASSSDNKRPIPAYCQEVSKLPKSVQPSEVLP